ncbi:Phosphatidylinositol N-acetylglucosaminyltransferase subunit C [Nymphon striatum]|nr:Phosphatidylinositol N-acetylglucosaminyltransferase subunit C [Nymphon striatum]
MNCGISASIPPSASPINTLVNLRELYPDRFLGLDFSKNIKGILLFVLFGYGTSPVLKTLTDTISSDTVFGMSVGMMFLHLAFFDYGLQASIVSGSLSFNAAIFSAVCLASRLHSIFDVFIFLTFAVHIFALLPVFFSKIQSLYKTKLSVQITCTLLVCISANLMLASISLFWTCNLLIVMIIINLVFPYFYVNWQHHKDNIYGPWDEAIIDDEDLKESINKPS